MMAARGLSIDHSTVHRWVVHFLPVLLQRFHQRKRAVTGKWHVDETYIKVRGRWMYLYRAIDSRGDTVEFHFSEHRDLAAAKRIFQECSAASWPSRSGCHRRQPDDLGSNRIMRQGKPATAPLAAPTEAVRQSQYLNNRIEQDHRHIRPMLGFKSTDSARTILSGIEMIAMMRKRDTPSTPVPPSPSTSTSSLHDVSPSSLWPRFHVCDRTV
jgi:transposase-like protein